MNREVKEDNNMEAFKHKLRRIAESLRRESSILRDGGRTKNNIRFSAAAMLYHADKIEEAIADFEKSNTGDEKNHDKRK